MAWSTKCAETAFVVVVVLSSVFNIFWRINLLWNCCTSLHTALQYLCDGLFGFCTIACPWMERGWGFDMDERRAFWDILQLSTPFTHPSDATSVHWSTTHHSLPPSSPPCPCPLIPYHRRFGLPISELVDDLRYQMATPTTASGSHFISIYWECGGGSVGRSGLSSQFIIKYYYWSAPTNWRTISVLSWRCNGQTLNECHRNQPPTKLTKYK